MARRYGVTYKTGRTHKGGDPNAVKSFSVNMPATKSMFKKQKRRYVSNTEAEIVGYLSLLIWIPLLLFFIYVFPKFFAFVFFLIVLKLIISRFY